MFVGARFRLIRILVASAVLVISSVSAQMQIGGLDAGGGLARELSLARTALGPIALSHRTDVNGRGSDSIVSVGH